MGFFGGVYKLLVVCSVIVVGIHLGWKYMVKPPAVASPPKVVQVGTAGEGPAFESEEHPAAEILERKDQFYNILLVGCDDGHGNADTIIVMGYDVTQGKAGLVSVPRDTLIERDWSGFPKLNAAFGKGGVALLRQEISETLGIPIDYYVKVDLNAFVRIVDELGGLDFYVPQDMYHDDEGGFIINLKKGQQHLTGRQVLELVRYRGYTNADVGRTQMQQQVLTALAKKALTLGSLTKITPFVEIFNQYVETDLALSDMLYFAQNALNADLQQGLSAHTLAGRGDAQKGAYTWCYELDPEDAVKTVNEMINPYTRQIAREDMELVSGDKYYFE